MCFETWGLGPYVPIIFGTSKRPSSESPTLPFPTRFVPPRRRCKCVACSLGSKNPTSPTNYSHLGVSENSGFSPQIIHFNKVFHYFHHPFWGTRIFGNTHLSEIEPKTKTAMTQPTESTLKKIFKSKHHSLVQTFGSPWVSRFLQQVRDETLPETNIAPKNGGVQ